MKRKEIVKLANDNQESVKFGNAKQISKKMKQHNNDSPSTSKAITLKTRMSPCAITKFIESCPSDEQIRDIEAIGFGGLLKLKTDTVPTALVRWLLSDFNTSACSLMNNQLQIKDTDIHIATGLPMGSIELYEATTSEKSEDFLEEKKKWLLQFGCIPKVLKRSLLDKLISQRAGGVEFKRNFIVYIASTLLMGVKGDTVSLTVLKFLGGDLANASNFNWCSFTRRQLVTSICNWQKMVGKGNTEASSTFVYKGPIMVLVFIYLDRVVFRWRTVERIFPTLANWGNDEIRRRVKEEKDVGFGKGCVEGPIVMDEMDKKQETMEDKEDKKDEQEEKNDAKEDQNDNSSVKLLAQAALEFAKAYDNFSFQLRKAIVKNSDSDFVKQMASLAEAVCDGYIATRQEGNVAASQKEEKLDRQEVERDEKNDEKVENADLLGEITDEAILEVFLKLEKTLGKHPMEEGEVKKKKVHFVDPTVPSFDLLGSDFGSTQETTQGSQQCPPETATPLSCVRRSSRIAFASGSGTHSGNGAYNASPVAFDVALNEEDSFSSQPSPAPFASGSGTKDTSPQEVEHEENLKTKRNVVRSNVYRSPFLQRNIDIFSHLTKLEKYVIDYALLDNSDEREILFSSGKHELTRSDLKSLVVGDNVSPSVIYVWCDILNKGEYNKSSDSPLRLFLYLSSSVDPTDGVEINFNDVDLIFVPHLTHVNPNPILFCANLSKSKLEVIHAMKPKSVKYGVYVKHVLAFMGKILKGKGKACENLFRFDVQEFVPKPYIVDGVDSGVYMMRFMDTYKGMKQGYTPCFKDSAQLKKFSCRACFRILTSDQNILNFKIKQFAHSMTCGLRQPAPSNRIEYTDAHLTEFVRKGDHASILVDTEWMQVTRKGMMSLKPRQWIMYNVIDIVGIKCSFTNPEFLFMPTIVKDLKPDGRKTLDNAYIKLHYMPNDGKDIKKVFIPLLNDDHWFCCVCDLEKKTTFILDSLMHKKKMVAKNQFASEVVYNVELAIDENFVGYDKLKGMNKFEVVNVKVPQQKNGYDCGVYVLKFLEATTDETLWTNTNYFKKLDEYRSRTMLDLLRWDMNFRKVFDFSQCY